MTWFTTSCEHTCYDCEEEFPEGTQMYETADGNNLCEGCMDDRADADEGRCYDLDDREESYYIDFQDPGGNSALRAASESNPRNLSCPTCGEENRLTPADSACGYQCDECANAAERGY